MKSHLQLVEDAKQVHEQSANLLVVISYLFKNDASFERTIKVLLDLGLEVRLVNDLMHGSSEWKNHQVSFVDSFFNFVELDDDLLME